jgi:hypothetical protein
MLRPGAISGKSAMICAAWPDEQQTAPAPPSSAAMRFWSAADGRVGQAGIDVADFLQAEERGGMVGVAEDISGGLIDRHLACAGGRIGLGACVNGQRVKALR